MVSSEIPFLFQFIHFPHIAGLQNECTRIKGEHWEEIRYPRSGPVVTTIYMICACFVLNTSAVDHRMGQTSMHETAKAR